MQHRETDKTLSAIQPQELVQPPQGDLLAGELVAQAPHQISPVLGYGNIIPASQSFEFAEIEASLQRCGAAFTKVTCFEGSAIYYVSEADLDKLPRDQHGPYLPVDDESGYKLIKIRQCYVDLMTTDPRAP